MNPSALRVLIAEDSVTQRKLLVTLLERDADVSQVFEARDGLEAVAMTKSLRPDVVVMDVRMPNLDGLAATKQIMIETPTPIVLVSDLEVEAVRASMKALNVGALSILQKPPTPSSRDFEREVGHFVSTIKALSRVRVVRHWSPHHRPAFARDAASPSAAGGSAVVTMAASTGGPAALFRILSQLPYDFPAPVMVVQHIAHGFASGLAEWLDTAGPLEVRLARAGEPVAEGVVYVAPDDHHLGITDGGGIVLDHSAPIDTFRPSASYMYGSVARAVGKRTIAVILTGMGRDGVRGLMRVRDAGGTVIAQDESSCMVFGMPRAAITAGAADTILPLDHIPAQLVKLASKLGD